MRELIRLVVDRWTQRDERGQTLVEYGLLLALIAIVVIAVLILLGPAVSGIFQSVNDQLYSTHLARPRVDRASARKARGRCHFSDARG